jgi:hypothetical protein
MVKYLIHFKKNIQTQLCSFFKALASMDGIIKYFEEYGLDLSLIEQS